MSIGSVVGTVSTSGSPGAAALWAPGLTLGAVAATATVGPSLFPRDGKTQAAAIGAAGLIGFGVGTAVEGVARGAARLSPASRMGTLGVLAGAGLLAWGAARTFGNPESSPIQGIGTVGAVTAAAAGASIAATALARHLPGHAKLAQLALPVIAGGAVLGMAIRDRVRTGNDFQLPDVDIPKVDQSEQLATRTLSRLSAAEAMPGVDPSTVNLDVLPPNGLRFLLERPTMEEITATMGEPAKAEPLRLYVGLDEAPEELRLPENEPQLIEWMSDRAMERMEAAGAFERERILVAATTSTGFINPVAPMSHEMMLLGDVATVGMQAAHKKAMFELDNLDRATAMHERLLAKIQDRIATMPEGERPTIDVYGESYGAWTSQDAFKGGGIDAMQAAGISHAMYTGSPRDSVFPGEIADDPRTLKLRSAAHAQELGGATATDPSVTLLTHDADPVANFAVADIWRRPDWLPTDGPRGEKISPHQKWWPGITGLQLGIDQYRAQFFTPGTLEAIGHDYRPEVGYVLRSAYNHDHVTDEQVARIREYGRQAEIRWVAARDQLLTPQG